MSLTISEVKSSIEKVVSGIRLKQVRDSLLIEDPAKLPEVARFLKTSPDYKLDYLSSITASDFINYLESVYHLYSMEKKTGPLVLRVRVPRDNAKMPSLMPVFRGAEFQERENFDLYGIVYEGHPDLRRIFMWEGFEGHPMRKDYVQEDSETLDKDDIAWLDAHAVAIPDDIRKRAENPPEKKAPPTESNQEN